jgi:ribonuclease P protein component
LSGYEFKKADRILKRRGFLRLTRNGKQVSDRHFIVRYTLSDVERSRLGITVTKKVGNAVNRNRLKRFVREYFRLNRHRIGNHLDLVIIAKRPAAGLNSNQTFNLLAKLSDQIPGNVDG